MPPRASNFLVSFFNAPWHARVRRHSLSVAIHPRSAPRRWEAHCCGIENRRDDPGYSKDAIKIDRADESSSVTQSGRDVMQGRMRADGQGCLRGFALDRDVVMTQ